VLVLHANGCRYPATVADYVGVAGVVEATGIRSSANICR
jgi:hypothetical protein